MTRIECGSLILEDDDAGWVLYERRNAKRGRNAGQETVVLVGYFGWLDQALHRMLDERAKLSDADTVEALLEEVKSARDLVTSIAHFRPEGIACCAKKLQPRDANSGSALTT